MTKIKGYRGRPVTCQNCGVEFLTKRSKKETPKSCSMECRYRKMPSWKDCAGCHAMAGIGLTTSAKITGINKKTIHCYLSKKGIKLDNKYGSWYLWRKKHERDSREWWEDNRLLTAWNKKQSPKFPDWSYLWVKEKARLKYQSMTKSERKKHNKKLWGRRDKDNAKKYLRRWKRAKSKSDPAWRIAQSMRTRLSGIVKGANMGGMKGFIGCNTEQLRSHIESKFTNRMTWDNYGTYWQIDHILPVASFDHSDKQQIKQCWHWTNLAPLESKANLTKSDRITKPQMQLMLECHA